MRRGVVRAENVGAPDHVERGEFIELPRLDCVSQLDRGDDALNAGLLRVFGKNDAFDLGPERRRDGFIFEFVHADMRREEVAIEDDAELAIGRPILRGAEGQLAIVGPFPGAGHRWIEPHMLHGGILQILEARRRFAELDQERWNLQLFVERRDRNGRDLSGNGARLRLALIPFPGPERAAREQEHEENLAGKKKRTPAAIEVDSSEAALEPERWRPGELAERSASNSSQQPGEPCKRANEGPQKVEHIEGVLKALSERRSVRADLARARESLSTPRKQGKNEMFRRPIRWLFLSAG